MGAASLSLVKVHQSNHSTKYYWLIRRAMTRPSAREVRGTQQGSQMPDPNVTPTSSMEIRVTWAVNGAVSQVFRL
jgi:hypothetical protein